MQLICPSLSSCDYTTTTNAMTFKEVQKETAFCGKEIVQYTQVCNNCFSINSTAWEGRLQIQEKDLSSVSLCFDKKGDKYSRDSDISQLKSSVFRKRFQTLQLLPSRRTNYVHFLLQMQRLLSLLQIHFYILSVCPDLKGTLKHLVRLLIQQHGLLVDLYLLKLLLTLCNFLLLVFIFEGILQPCLTQSLALDTEF